MCNYKKDSCDCNSKIEISSAIKAVRSQKIIYQLITESIGKVYLDFKCKLIVKDCKSIYPCKSFNPFKPNRLAYLYQ